AQQIEIARQHHEVSVRSLQRVPVILAEIADRAIAGHKTPQKPDQLHIAPRFTLKTPRGSYLIEIAIQIQLQQIGWIIWRLPRPTVASGVPEPKRGEIESAHVSLDRTHRIVRGHVILDPRRKKTSLLSGLSNLEDAIRHATNRNSIRPVAKYSCPASQARPVRFAEPDQCDLGSPVLLAKI